MCAECEYELVVIVISTRGSGVTKANRGIAGQRANGNRWHVQSPHDEGVPRLALAKPGHLPEAKPRAA